MLKYIPITDAHGQRHFKKNWEKIRALDFNRCKYELATKSITPEKQDPQINYKRNIMKEKNLLPDEPVKD